MKVLVIGGGSIGQRHIKNLQDIKGIKVTACTRNSNLGPQLGVATYADLNEAWRGQPTVVIVANITSQHMPIALVAAERGCHLLIEKPLSHATQGSEALKSIRNRKKLVVMVGCNMRFHPALRVIKQALAEKSIGAVLAVEAHSGSYLPDWRPGRDYRSCYSSLVRQGGGVILDLIHELDYLFWFFGKVQAVTAFAGKRSSLEIESDDVADMLLQFRSGLVAQVHLDYVQRTPTRGCRIVGQEGTLVWDNEKARVVLLRPSAQEQVLWNQPHGYDQNEMYVEEMKHFLSCIETGKTPLISLEDGEAVLQIALAAKTAAREQRVVLL